MPKLKRILINVFFETAKGKRHCSRNRNHLICKGTKCFVIKENMGKKSYCLDCAREIIFKTKEMIDGYIRELEN